MADSTTSRSNSLRIPRLRGTGSGTGTGVGTHGGVGTYGGPGGNTTRNVSSAAAAARRSSVLLDDHRQPSAGAFHSLRSTGSRYSLNEQFAATRREYEFGDDDASSIYERMTLASDAGDPNGDRAFGLDHHSVIPEEEEDGLGDVEDVVGRADHYEVLCLPRDARLSQDQIRQAYFRWLPLLHPDGYPEQVQHIVRRYFDRVQEAFETLVDPHRRAVYDAALASIDKDEPVLPETCRSTYQDTYKEALGLCAGNAASSDLTVQLGGATLARPGANRSPPSARPALGFTLGHTVQVGIPGLEAWVRQGLAKISSGITSKATGDIRNNMGPGLRLGTPSLAISGALHGLFTDTFPKPILLHAGRPLGPSLSRPSPSSPPVSRNVGRPAIRQPEMRLTRLFSTDYAEEVWKSPHDPAVKDVAAQWQQQASKATEAVAATTSTSASAVTSTISAATAADVLPLANLTARLSQPILLPGAANPTVLEAAIGGPALGAGCLLPSVSIGVHHQFSRGTAFVRGGHLLTAALPSWAAPTALEAGFTTELVSVSSDGVGLDGSGGGGDWTVFASTSGAAATAGCVRYGRDLVLFPGRGQRSGPRRGSGLARLEVEACAGSALRGSYLALRSLLPLGRLSAAGLEVSVSRHSLHLSVHWSRPGQRVSLPVLFCPRVASCSSPSVVFWAGALPLVGLAAIELLRQHWPWPRRRRRHRSLAPDGGDNGNEDPSQSAAAYASIARHRTEADRLATLLAGPVEARQRYSAALGGLVILNAKFGVRDDVPVQEDDDGNSTVGSWAAEEVADVTVALAALVDRDGCLCVPRGVRKGHLLGFWDPAPDREKVLLVRYSWNGREALAEAKGLDELRLPPPAEGMSVG